MQTASTVCEMDIPISKSLALQVDDFMMSQ
jgi:hypothetical protein